MRGAREERARGRSAATDGRTGGLAIASGAPARGALFLPSFRPASGPAPSRAFMGASLSMSSPMVSSGFAPMAGESRGSVYIDAVDADSDTDSH